MSLLLRRHTCQITNILYDLVTQALGGRNVKCVVNDGECIFTTDIEILLSRLENEHPEYELILQSLKSHKSQFGEGIKSFLFILTRIARAMEQLEQLGIAHIISTSVMQEVINKLRKEVCTIAIPVVIQEQHAFDQHTSKDCSVLVSQCVEQVGQPARENVLSNVFHRSKNLDLEHPDDSRKSVNDIVTRKAVDGNDKDKLNLRSCTGIDPESETSSGGVAESDFVYLRMAKCSSRPGTEQDSDVEDIEWFFDRQPPKLSSGNEFHEILKVDGHSGISFKNCKNHVMDIINGKNSNSSEFYSDFQGDARHKETHLSLDKDSHDSDFEDCFEDIEQQNYKTDVFESVITDQNILKVSGLTSNMDVNQKEILNTKLLPVNDDFEESLDVSFYPRKTSNQIQDEFDGCFKQESHSVNNIESSLSINEINNESTEYKNAHLNATNGPQVINEEKHNSFNSKTTLNLKQKQSYSNNQLNLSEITKLNSLLKQLGNHKSHNIQKPDLSTRHDIKREDVEDGENQDCLDLSESTIRDESANNKGIIKSFSSTEKDPNVYIKSLEYVSTDNVCIPSKSTSVSKIDKIDKVLKRLSAQNPSVNTVQITTSSRHMNYRGESQHQREINRVEMFDPNGPKPSLESVNQHLCKETGLMKGDDCFEADLSKIQNFGCLQNHGKKFDHIPDRFQKKSPTDAYNGNNVNTDLELTDGDWSLKEIQIPQDIYFLSRESEDLIQLVTQAYMFQNGDGMTNSQRQRFDLSKVHCVSVQSSHCIKQVVRGLVIKCSGNALKMINPLQHKRNTVLVNGDMKPSFVHKGHKSSVAKKTLVERETTINFPSLGQEHSWASKVVDVIRRLQVEVLLVKGRMCDILSDMLYKENILVLTNVPFRVLQIINQTHGVSLVTYIQDATVNDLCQLSCQPLDKDWMDRDRDSHCLLISDLPQIQTIFLQLPSMQSCHIEEERVWKCLHRLSHALKDGLVLPGYGLTELWCEGRIRTMTKDWPGGFCPQTDLIVQALADVFHDYTAVVQRNVKPVFKKNESNVQSSSLLECTCVTNPGYMDVQKEELLLSSSEFQDCHTHQFSEQHLEDKKEKVNASFDNMNINNRSTSDCRTEHVKCKKCVNGKIENDISTKCNLIRSENDYQCDSFTSKVSSWSSAIDLVTVLLSLDSLVVTGASSSDLGTGGILL